MQIENKKILHTDILIIGGGTAGCYAALTIREQSDYSIVIAEKANLLLQCRPHLFLRTPHNPPAFFHPQYKH